MHILLLVLFVSVLVLLWAAFSVARHIQRHKTERKINLKANRDTADQEAWEPAGIKPTAKIAKVE